MNKDLLVDWLGTFVNFMIIVFKHFYPLLI